MATFHFELVSPEKISFSGEVDQVDVPGAEGDFGVLAGHAPLIALIRPGVMTVYAAGAQTKLVVLGGFAEVGPDGLTVLADVATSLEDLDRAVLQKQISQLEQGIKELTQGSELDRQIARLDHFKALDQHLDGTAMH
jgi:F-type H+-transporting ATPase subunit epsilon